MATKVLYKVYPLDNLPAHDAMRTAALLIQDDIALMIEDANGAYFLRAGAFILPGKLTHLLITSCISIA